jgi:hypothetical protein
MYQLKEMEGYSPKDFAEMWDNQHDIRKINVIRTLQNGMLVTAMMCLAPAMFGFDDKELNKRHNAFLGTRMYKTIGYSFMDMISAYNVKDYYNATLNPFFAISQIGKYGTFLGATLSLNTKDMDVSGRKAFGLWRTVGSIYDTASGSQKPEKKTETK